MNVYWGKHIISTEVVLLPFQTPGATIKFRSLSPLLVSSPQSLPAAPLSTKTGAWLNSTDWSNAWIKPRGKYVYKPINIIMSQGKVCVNAGGCGVTKQWVTFWHDNGDNIRQITYLAALGSIRCLQDVHRLSLITCKSHLLISMTKGVGWDPTEADKLRQESEAVTRALR